MWEINSYSQYLCFLYSVLMGGAIGLLYDFFKIDRIIFKRSRWFIIFADILFWVISAFIFYSFAVVFSNGQVRGYLLFSSLLGFIIYKLTLSKLIILIISPIKKASTFIKKLYLTLLVKINHFFNLILQKLKFIIKKLSPKKFDEEKDT